MKYFLDTNICICFLKAKYLSLKQKILSENPENIKIPSIVKAELLYGAEKSQKKEENIEKISQFLFPLEVVGFNDAESIEYSKIRADLEKRGDIICPNDLVIAAIVYSNNGIIVTNNKKEFQKVKGLKIENWVS
jgi:tRNA(fMet)-specific endonuclease VapC